MDRDRLLCVDGSILYIFLSQVLFLAYGVLVSKSPHNIHTPYRALPLHTIPMRKKGTPYYTQPTFISMSEDASNTVSRKVEATRIFFPDATQI